MDINMDLLQWSIFFLIKKTSGIGIKNENMSDQQLAEELHKSTFTFYRQYLRC